MSPTILILIINVVVYLLEVSGGATSHRIFQEYGAVSLEGIQRGFVWQLLTYQFMHGGLMHLLLNSIGLYFFGQGWMLASWCELRGDFRNFRLDRIANIRTTERSYKEEPGKTLNDFIRIEEEKFCSHRAEQGKQKVAKPPPVR